MLDAALRQKIEAVIQDRDIIDADEIRGILAQPVADDGRPYAMDVFVGKLFEACDDHWDRSEAIKHWMEGDWPSALEYLETDED